MCLRAGNDRTTTLVGRRSTGHRPHNPAGHRTSTTWKTGVIRADLYDPLTNRAYAEMAEHYGCLIDPARAQKPKDKPRVERVIQYVRDSFWRGRSFASLTDMQTRAVSWCREVAGVRAHRSLLEGASPLAVFAALEAPALLGLPARPFELARWLSGEGGAGLSPVD
jgi:hypothetical protein